ncbi:fimbrial assembly protein fimC [Bacteroidia bacterium]|nr:fimbrial assembly protein fimC [Bacteroidia bacterium]
MSSFQLKIIAIVSMLIDHIAWGLAASAYIRTHFVTEINAMHIAGRMAFPIFAFLISEGVVHTRSVKKYLAGMCVFALISEIPYNLLHSVYRFHTLNICYPRMQNVFFTLALGIIAIIFYKKMIRETALFNRCTCFLLIILTLIAACILRVDYGWLMVLAILILYIYKDSQLRLPIFAVFIVIFYLLISYKARIGWAAGALCALVPLYCYNGQRGRNLNKWLFYAFYPVHLLIIALLAATVFGYV